MDAEPLEVPPVGEGFGATFVGRLPGGQHLPPLARVVVVFVAVALAFLFAALWTPWGFILLGGATAGLAARGVGAVNAGLRPLLALAQAALPLSAPLLVFAAAGVINESFALKFVVGVAALTICWRWLIRPDIPLADRVREAHRDAGSGARRAFRIGLLTLVVLPALALVVVSAGQLLAEGADLSRALFVVAVGLLAMAAILRLLSYGGTLFRGLVSLALLVLLWRLAVEIGLVTDTLIGGADIGTIAAVSGALLGLTALAEIATTVLVRDDDTGLTTGRIIAAFLEPQVVAKWLTEAAAVAGMGLAMASAAFMAVAVYDASTTGGAKEAKGAEARVTVLATPPSEMSPSQLAEAFAPVLAFTKDQRWTPIPVDGYIANAWLRDWEGRRTRVHSLSDLKLSCPGIVKSPCYVLRQACAKGRPADACAEALPQSTKRVYVRVALATDWNDCTRAEPCADGSPNPFANAKGPHAGTTTILVQYWFFYAYNDWSAPVAIGDLQEIHAADWEAVTVGLSNTEPLWVAYSQHCGGSWADWGTVPVAPSDPLRLRPLVAVANGSQANYRVARATRVPNFAECSGIPKDLLRLTSYAANVRDRTDDARLWSPGAGDLELVTAKDLPMSFPGTWAPFARMQLKTLRKDNKLGTDTAGPATPTYQRLWQSPMHEIFAGRGWKEG